MKTTLNQTSAWAIAIVLSLSFFAITISMAFEVGDAEQNSQMQMLMKSDAAKDIDNNLNSKDQPNEQGEVLIRADDIKTPESHEVEKAENGSETKQDKRPEGDHQTETHGDQNPGEHQKKN